MRRAWPLAAAALAVALLAVPGVATAQLEAPPEEPAAERAPAPKRPPARKRTKSKRAPSARRAPKRKRVPKAKRAPKVKRAPKADPAPARSRAVVGIAEQQPTVFADPLFAPMGIRNARLLVGWNGIHSSWQRQQMDAWLNAAREANVDPLVTFGRSRTNRLDLPTPERFLDAFRAFRQRYPWVRTFATWNEANHSGEPVFKRPDLVATFWRGMRAACPGCTVLAAELIDLPNVPQWTALFRYAAGVEPRAWGLHNYLDANLFTTAGTQAMLDAVPGDIWLTETGGIVSRRNRSKLRFPEGTAHAAAATRFVLDRLLALSPRVRRVYLYHWRAQPGLTTWDSGLVDSQGAPRPAYGVLRDRLQRPRSASR